MFFLRLHVSHLQRQYPIKKHFSPESTFTSSAGSDYRQPVFSPETTFVQAEPVSPKTMAPRPHVFPVAPMARQWSRQTDVTMVRTDMPEAPPLKTQRSTELLRARQMRTPAPPANAPVGPIPTPPMPVKSLERPVAPQSFTGEPVETNAQLQQRGRSRSRPRPQPFVTGTPPQGAF